MRGHYFSFLIGYVFCISCMASMMVLVKVIILEKCKSITLGELRCLEAEVSSLPFFFT